MGLPEFIRRAIHNLSDLFTPELFSRDLTRTRLLFLESFLVNKPDYIEQVLLTNQQNYAKSQFVQRLLAPLLGQGLLTSEGGYGGTSAELPRQPSSPGGSSIPST